MIKLITEDGIEYRVSGMGHYKLWKLNRLNGNLHRLSGPAIEYSDGTGDYYLYGIKFTEKVHRSKVRKIKLKSFLSQY